MKFMKPKYLALLLQPQQAQYLQRRRVHRQLHQAMISLRW